MDGEPQPRAGEENRDDEKRHFSSLILLAGFVGTRLPLTAILVTNNKQCCHCKLRTVTLRAIFSLGGGGGRGIIFW